MLIPVNGHILIEPIKHESFISTSQEIFEEIGIVVDVSEELGHIFDPINGDTPTKISKGDKVFFDPWLAAKFPKNEADYFWLVKWEDVRAIEKNEKE